MLYYLIILNIEGQKYENKNLGLPVTKNVEDFATKLSEINKYLGYMGWAEIYLQIPSRVDDGRNVLGDLIKEYPNYPHAYLRLWSLFTSDNAHKFAIDIAEILHVKNAEIASNNELGIIIPLMYAKSLFANEMYKECFELLQTEFFKNPKWEIFLYKYGKYVIQSKQEIFYGSAIGILEECLGCCSSQGKPKIHFYLGLGFKYIRRPLRAFEHFEQSNKLFNK